ncbi:MAG TPA: amidohydrolase family protein [Clostridiales bacterium]|jgi:predicted TIM-barrel fold metal-dependent hydrolase|nr:amidohydrolase family protein [Clostridiales bacterium]
MLFPITAYDREEYESIKELLPPKMIDIHCHVWRNSDIDKSGDENKGPRRTVTWPDLVAAENPIEDLFETYRLMFPGIEVTPLIFGTTGGSSSAPESMKPQNRYIAKVSKEHGIPALYYSHPRQSAEELEVAIKIGNFRGIKSYLDLSPAYLPEKEIRIYDFFPPEQLEVIDRMGGIVMLHIPRPCRLRDPVNIAQIIEIKQRWKKLRLIIAHIGRAYCVSDVGDALERLCACPDCDDLLFDFCANTNAEVMRQLLDAVGPKRVLWGTDLPITRMRMRRIEENGTYINLVPPGMYPSEVPDPHLREVCEEEAEKITFFMYEEIKAMKQALENSKNASPEDACDIFYGNAARLLEIE